MGTWGVEPWEDDEAADWFADMFQDLKVENIQAALQFDDNFAEIRAACYVLQTLGRVYIWPVEHLDELKVLLDTGIELLTNILNPPDQAWDYLELWDNDPEIITSVQQQLAELKERRAGIV
jgi:hypothetical protein